MPCEKQRTYTCYDGRQLRHVSLNVFIVVSDIQRMKHHIKYENI